MFHLTFKLSNNANSSKSKWPRHCVTIILYLYQDVQQKQKKSYIACIWRHIVRQYRAATNNYFYDQWSTIFSINQKTVKNTHHIIQ